MKENNRSVWKTAPVVIVTMVILGASWGAATLAALLLFKGLAYTVSLGSLFRGGPVFPALFLGVTAGILLSTLVPEAVFEPYFLWRAGRDLLTETSTTGNLDQKTIGSRFNGGLPAGFDYGIEMALQTGSLGSNSINTWAGHAPGIVSNLFAEAAWGSTPVGRPVGGTAESVAALTRAQSHRF